MTAPTIMMSLGRHHTDVMSETAHQCPRCHQMAWWWVNRAGETFCVSCAEEKSHGSPKS